MKKFSGKNEKAIMVDAETGALYIKMGQEPGDWMHKLECTMSVDTSQFESGQLIPIDNVEQIGSLLRKLWEQAA